MENVKPKDDDFYIRNAIYCWLYYFGEDHQWHAKYKELSQRDSYLTKPRPARRTKRATKPTTTES